MPGGVTLLAPVGLAALVALVAIILIHMRRRTPPAITMPSLRFWEPAGDDSSDKRRLRKPPITLPLILQLLAALIIGLALARPAMDALPGLASQRTMPEHTMVILDGSTSMLATASDDDARIRWELAQDETDQILEDWQAGDVITVITIGSRIQSSSASTQQQVDTLRSRMRSADAPGGIADIDAALELSADLVMPDRSNRLVLITDGAVRANPEIAASVAAPIELRVVGNPDNTMPNVAITSIGSRSVISRNDTYRLSFSMSSFAPDAVRLPYRVQADGVDVVSSEVDLGAGETRSVEVTLPQGAKTADVMIDVRDSFVADNRATLLLGSASTAGLDILLISDNPDALERALGALPESSVDVFPTSTPGIRALAAGFDLVVFQGVSPAPDDIPAVPMLFVRPPQLGDRFVADGVMTAPQIDQLEAGDPILNGVDLAGVTFGDTPAYQLGSGDEELVGGSANGVTGPLLWRGNVEDQRYVAFGFDLETSNITQRVAFPVLIARSVSDLTVAPMASTLGLGEPLLFRATDNATEVAVTDPSGETTTLAISGELNTVLFEGTGLAGLYSVREIGEQDQVLEETAFVVNAGHPIESDLRPNPSLEAALQGGTASNAAVMERQGLADIWPMLVAIATAVIALEWVVFHAGRWRLPTLRNLSSLVPRAGGRA